MKKSTGKGHTLYDDSPPSTAEQIWTLLAESCYEISGTLLEENSYARALHFFVCAYDWASHKGGVSIFPEGQLRHPEELYRTLRQDPRVEGIIREKLIFIRRVQLNVECEPYVEPLFSTRSGQEDRYVLLEHIRRKCQKNDVIGLGLEGMRSCRPKTYTWKRADEILRAMGLLMRIPLIRELLRKYRDRIWLPGQGKGISGGFSNGL